MNLLNDKDMDNLLTKYIREVQPIDNSKINNEIKKMMIDERHFFNFEERIFYYNEIQDGRYKKATEMLQISCCKKCGGYLQHSHKKIKCICKNNFN